MKRASLREPRAFAEHLRKLADAVEKDPKRFKHTVDALSQATAGTAAADSGSDDDDDDDDDEIDWGEVAFIGIMILTL